MRIYESGSYRIATPEEIAEIEKMVSQQEEISHLKILLDDTDYQAIKFAEGVMSAEEFEPTRKQRQAWRERINELEAGGEG